MKSRIYFYSTVIIILIMTVCHSSQGQIKYSNPVFKVDMPDPTADKPQSKLWFNDSCWWALLPRKKGLSLWQRHPQHAEWTEHVDTTSVLWSSSGKPDVWFVNDTAFVVVAHNNKLVVLTMAYEKKNKKWKTKLTATLVTAAAVIETATIGRDKNNSLWVAADVNNQVMVWSDINAWSTPLLLEKNISGDDICTIGITPNSTMVIWSDQLSDAIRFSEHKNNNNFDDWTSPANIDSGNKTADDHLHYRITPDETIVVATKNSFDSIGYPQLVLRVKEKGSGWSNYPYALRFRETEPSRPVVVCLPDGNIMAGHTIYNKTNRATSHIEFGKINIHSGRINYEPCYFIHPDPKLHSAINNITVPKHNYPIGVPAIFLASDGQGRVYEGVLPY